MEDDLKKCTWKMTSMFAKTNLYVRQHKKILCLGDNTKKKTMQPNAIEFKTLVVALLQVT